MLDSESDVIAQYTDIAHYFQYHLDICAGLVIDGFDVYKLRGSVSIFKFQNVYSSIMAWHVLQILKFH